MIFVLNYTSSTQLFGQKRGLALIKYYDTQYIFCIFIGVFVNFYCLSSGSLRTVFVTMFLVDAIGLVLMTCFYPYTRSKAPKAVTEERTD